MSKMPSHKPAAEGSCSPTGPKEAGPFGKVPKGVAEPHSTVRHSLQSKTLLRRGIAAWSPAKHQNGNATLCDVMQHDRLM